MAENARIARMKQKAWSMLEANRPEESLAAFKECVSLEPENLHHRIEYGVALYKLGRLDESLEELDRVLSKDSGHILALNNKARILIDRGDSSGALSLYKKILQIDPRHLRTWVKAAQLMLSLGRYDKADGCIEEALLVAPEDPELWRERAVIARSGGELERALTYIGRSLGVKATSFESLRERANILSSLGRFGEAVEDYRAALRQKPEDLEVRELLGFAYLAQGFGKEALDVFESVMKEEAGRKRSRVWEGRGRAFELLGEGARGLVNRATAAMMDGRYDEALELFDRATELDKNFPEAWSNRGVLLEKMGRYDEASESYRRALSLDHAAVVCMHNLGMLCIYHLDRREEGLSWLKNTLKYDQQRWFRLPSELRSAVDAAPYPKF